VLERFIHVVTRHALAIVVTSCLITFVAALVAMRLRLDPDMLNFLPAGTAEVNAFREVLDALGTLDQHVVAVQVPAGAEADDYTQLIDRLAQDYEAHPAIDRVEHRLPNFMSTIERLLPRAMLFLTPGEIDAAASRLTDEAIAEAMATNRALLQTPQSGAIKDLVRLDPLRLHSILLERFSRASGGFRFDASSGYLLSADRSTFVIIARPLRPAHDLPFSAAMMEASAAIERRAVDWFRRTHPDVESPVIAYAGGYAISHDDATLIRKDVIGNVAFSFTGVLLLFLLAFRRAAAVLYAAVPMAIAVVVTFAVGAMAFGTLSSAAGGFAALLAGLGIDFITVFYGRYVEERRRGESTDEALYAAIRTSLPGIAVAAVTTSITFYAFFFTDFRGMSQMGLLTGTGILLFLVAVAVVLPALIAIIDRRLTAAPRTPRMTSFGSSRLVRAVMAHPRRTIAVWTAVIAAASVASLALDFNDDPANIRARGNRGVETQEMLARKFGQSFDFILLVAEGTTIDHALARSETLRPKLDALAARGVIGGYQTLTSIIPSPPRQREVMAALERGRNDAFDADRITASLAQAAEANGFRVGAFDDYSASLRVALAPHQPLRVEAEEDPILRLLRERFVAHTSGKWLSLTYLYPPKEKWGRSVAPELTQIARSAGGVTLTGVNVVSSALRRIARADAVRATSIGLVAVFLFFTVVFRSARTAAFLFVPFAAGCVGMTGLMSIGGLSFNPLNVFVGLMLIAVGTDYAVYMLQRYREAPGSFTAGAEDTAESVSMAALTTIVGYGSFALSHYPGLRSIGYASAFGVAISGFAAITLVPALLALARKR
jgi:predicted RND superfamily exporter protein